MTPIPPEVPPTAESLLEQLSSAMIGDRARLARRIERARRADVPPREMERLARDIEAAVERRAIRAGSVPPVRYPDDLPVSDRRDEIKAAIAANQVVVVAGETGSGKTTQLPKMCLELGRGVDGLIGHTQPRRIAARTVAERLADELGVELGGAVGYAVRFADTIGDRTLVKVMTDGILLAEIRSDRRLAAYDTIIVDEAHERSLNIDFLLGYLAQLLPSRPDLKVVITSATIDTARFASHFEAPVVEVSGRTYPVEIRYRPVAAADEEDEDAGDPGQALCDAVAEVVRDNPGDVLVFLPGERDIRDAADILRSRGPEGLDILPLYARLSAAEQHRVFQPHRATRVVLATNVAETSLTVPGIRSVVDTGLARISRYSHRTKVQRLRIENISKASADQRAGRCGRIAPGVCVRLYSEEDFEARPDYTDPEILRTNLAAVMLQMAAARLGAVESFPFIDAPDRRSVADGRAVLEELGAFEPGGDGDRLTPLGRRLAGLPLDPRLARMVVEAERRDCLREVVVIAAAMAVQDPRERPAESGGEAAALHRRFEVPGSDFLAYVRLWDHLADMQRELSGNQFRKRCRSEYLNVMRIREWQDVAGQIRQVLRADGIRLNRDPAAQEQVHQALLSGLLSHVGMRDRVRGDYQGARGTRWRIGRDSVLSGRQPAWAMAGSVVETGRTWARTVAAIEPVWAERIGAHLTRHSYSEPWWDSRRGEAMTEERVSLYGLPIVAGRPVSLARRDPASARAMFIQRALVEREWEIDLAPLEQTRKRIESIRALEERLRRRDVLAGDEPLYDFYETAVPPEVTNGSRFLRWWRRVSEKNPGALDVPLTILLDRSKGPIELSGYPDEWECEDLRIPLRYRYAPGEADDGVTAVIPVGALNRLGGCGWDWNVPGYRAELVSALIRLLPKDARRALGPAPQAASAVLAATGPEDGPLLVAVARQLSVMAGQAIRSETWANADLPAHLRMAFEVVDSDRRLIARGRDLSVLQRELAAEVRRAIAGAAPGIERRGATTWEFGDLPRIVERGVVRAYPALVDEGETVGVGLFESPLAQAHSMWQGTRRLLVLANPVPVAHLQRRLTNDTKLALAHTGVKFQELVEDCTVAVIDGIIARHGGPAYEATAYEVLATDARDTSSDAVASLMTVSGGVLAAADGVRSDLERLAARGATGQLAVAIGDVRRQVDDLVHPEFVRATGATRLPNLLRYLEAARQRIERLPGDQRRDAARQAVVDRVAARYETYLDRVVAGTAAPGLAAGLAEVRWMIEELRVSLWAQTLGTAAPISEERVMRALDQLPA